MPIGASQSDPIDAYLARWDGTEQAERASYVAFLNELCPLINAPLPDAARSGGGDYRYERSVTHRALEGAATTRRIDLYRRDRFILEAKQGANPERKSCCSARTKLSADLTCVGPAIGLKQWWRRRVRPKAMCAIYRQMKSVRLS